MAIDKIQNVIYDGSEFLKNAGDFLKKTYDASALSADINKIQDVVMDTLNMNDVEANNSYSCPEGSESIECYGGSQGNLLNNFDNYSNDDYIRNIIKKYYYDPKLTFDDIKLLFAKMDNTGCGYIACVNEIFEKTKDLSDEEFFDKFGFFRYKIVKKNGQIYRTLNYDYMFLDFYLYYQKTKGYSSIKDIYGNIGEFYDIGDGALSDQDKEKTGAVGTNVKEASTILKAYLNEKNININIDYISEHLSDKNFFQAFLEVYSPFNTISTTNNIKNALKDGKNVMISMNDFTMYYPEDKDGNGKLDDVFRSNVGPHAMLVTEVLSDGSYVVSSWGNKFIVRPETDSLWERIQNKFTNADETLNDYLIFD